MVKVIGRFMVKTESEDIHRYTDQTRMFTYSYVYTGIYSKCWHCQCVCGRACVTLALGLVVQSQVNAKRIVNVYEKD